MPPNRKAQRDTKRDSSGVNFRSAVKATTRNPQCSRSAGLFTRKFRRRDELADPEFLISISSGDLNVLPAVVLNFENLVAKVLPITISSAAMVKEKGRLIGIGIFELDERFSTLDIPAALCALLYFRHCFLTYRRLEQAFAMLMGDTLASRDRRILVLRLELVTRAVDRMKVPGTGRLCF